MHRQGSLPIQLVAQEELIFKLKLVPQKTGLKFQFKLREIEEVLHIHKHKVVFYLMEIVAKTISLLYLHEKQIRSNKPIIVGQWEQNI